MNRWILPLLALLLPGSLVSAQHEDDFDDYEEELPDGMADDPVSPVPQFTLPSRHLTCPTEEVYVLDEVFASSSSHKGAYRVVESVRSDGGHVSLLYYPTSFEECLGDCGVLQRIDRYGRLHTPQLYVTHTGQLKALAYGSGLGRVMYFDRFLKLFTWHKILISMLEGEIRVCVSTIFTSHCHIYLDPAYEFQPNGVWIVGGTAHKIGALGFVKEVMIVPGGSYADDFLLDTETVNKVIPHLDPFFTLTLAEVVFLCKAKQIGGISQVDLLNQDTFECSNEVYPRSTTCSAHLGGLLEKRRGDRLVLEARLIHHHISPLLGCQGKDKPERVLRKALRTGKSLKSLAEDTLTTAPPCTVAVLWLLAACHGHPDLLFKLAVLLKTGVVLPARPQLARELIVVAASQGSTLANLALASQPGASCPSQFAYYGVAGEQYIEQWKSAVSRDLIAAERVRLQHGVLGQHEGTNDEVFQFLNMQAEQGDPEAQANVARMYYWGQGGVDRDMDRAFEMQHAAAQQGHADGLFDTGIMLLKGQGTARNVTRARQYLERAVKAGNKAAPGTLGYLELNENGNVTGAVHYFNISHNMGDTDSTHNLAVIQSFYQPFDTDPYYSHRMFKKAAENGHKESTMITAEQSLHGVHNITGNCSQAVMFMKSLAEQSDVITRLLREGQELFEDSEHDKAFLLYLFAAEAGAEIAQYNVAWLCQEFSLRYAMPDCSELYYKASALAGYGPSQAMTANNLWKRGRYYEAARMYARAASNNVEEGLFGLGYFAREGIPVGMVTINSTSHYFGPQPNRTLTRTLWTECVQMGADPAVIGCGVPLLLELVRTISVGTVLSIVTPAIVLVSTLAYGLSRGNH